MRVLTEVGRIIGCLIFCVFCVLFVPSASWSVSDDLVPSDTSSPSSPASESVSPSAGPTSSGPSSPSPAGEPSVSPGPAEETSSALPEPTATETVTVQAEPEPAPEALQAEGTEADPMIVRLDDESTSLLLLTAAFVALGVGARIVGSFGGA